MKWQLVTAGLAAGALAMTLAGQPSWKRPPDRPHHHLTPGVHRASPAELAVRDQVAAQEAAKIRARRQLRVASVPSTTWVNVGPTDAFKEYNDANIAGVDSGRPNAIVVDPRDSNVIYLAASGGGVWKTFDGGQTWSPLEDILPNLAAGALALDPDHPDTVFLGNGDFVDASGDTILKSTDGGGTWSAPVQLPGVGSIRQIAVAGGLVLAGTDAGLFASSDGGASFTPVDLPNRSAIVQESIWSVVWTGANWVVSGVPACAPGGPLPPLAFGSDPGTMCPEGNDGTIWTSTDGATWTIATQPATTGVGRIAISAGPQNVAYAMVGTVDNFTTLGFWRSMDGGATWSDATGTLANPTLAVVFGNTTYQDCEGMNLGHDQTWYNEAIVVDPTNPDHVLVGGNLCGARTLNGTSATPTWELVSHWLPEGGTGSTATGMLPYVHADWHTATAVATSSGVRAFAGTDGGIFSSDDLWAQTVPEAVTWTHHNKGLITHLIYDLASGDPANGDAFVLFGGLQDNGTRYRTTAQSPSVFDQVVGGDGIGATIHNASTGTTYWASVEYGHLFCQPSSSVDCGQGSSWNEVEPTLTTIDPHDDGREPPITDPDMEPFLVHYANVETDTTGQSVLTHSVGQVFVSALVGGQMAWVALSQNLTGTGNGLSNVVASRTIAGLYGAVGNISRAPFYFTTQGNTQTTWTVTQPVRPTGTAARLTGPSSMDFPPVVASGKSAGQVIIGAFTGTLNDAARTPPPDDKGHLYRTTDFGQTWTSIVGADPAHRLPNVPVNVVKYDPVTATTIYAGTDLGVYISLDDGATWDRMGDNFPMVPVRDIYVAKNQDFIRVATYGRGFWEIYPSAGANQGAFGNGDFDRNLRLDWVDLGAMASRLGVTPATTQKPLYSWIMDMTPTGMPPVAAIDDQDLAALLAKFGGHP